MFYTLPPAPPAIVYVEANLAQGEPVIASDCKERGSRHCFPTDRVGYHPSDVLTVATVSFPATSPNCG